MAIAASSCLNIQKSLAWCQGTPEYAGVRRRIYYLAKSEIVVWPLLERDANGIRATSAKYKGDFTLKADAKWKYIDILPDKSQLTSEPQGELPSQTQLNKLVAVHPGVGAEASAAANGHGRALLAPTFSARGKAACAYLFLYICS